jgi:hypothetical protein
VRLTIWPGKGRDARLNCPLSEKALPVPKLVKKKTNAIKDEKTLPAFDFFGLKVSRVLNILRKCIKKILL